MRSTARPAEGSQPHMHQAAVEATSQAPKIPGAIAACHFCRRIYAISSSHILQCSTFRIGADRSIGPKIYWSILVESCHALRTPYLLLSIREHVPISLGCCPSSKRVVQGRVCLYYSLRDVRLSVDRLSTATFGSRCVDLVHHCIMSVHFSIPELGEREGTKGRGSS